MKQENITINVTVYSPNELNTNDALLVKSAFEACKTSYAPYSNFNVGAAVLLANGEIINGSNQENIAYPSGLCAERTAMFYANAKYPDVPIIALAVASSVNGVPNKEAVYPCGSCRQALLENELKFKNNIRVLMAGAEIVKEVESIKSLLPLSFDNF